MKKDPRLEVHTSDLGFSFGVRDGSKSMIAGMNKSGKYGAELKFSVKSMDVMKVMVKSDSKSSNDALKGTMAQIKGEDYTDLQADAPDIKETNTIMESLDAIENLKADFTVSDYYSVYYYTERRHFSAFAGSAVFLHISRSYFTKHFHRKSNSVRRISNVIDILRTGGYNMRYLWGRCLRYVDASMCVLKAK